MPTDVVRCERHGAMIDRGRTALSLALVLLVGCGDVVTVDAGADAGSAMDASRADAFVPMELDAGRDAGRDAGHDAGTATDAGLDAGRPDPDAGTDAGFDAGFDAGPGCMPRTCGAACGSVPDGCGVTLSCPACGTGFECVANACVPARNRAVTTIDGVVVTDAGLLPSFSVHDPATDTVAIYFGRTSPELLVILYGFSTRAPGTYTCGSPQHSISIVRSEWSGGGAVTCSTPPPSTASGDTVTSFSLTIDSVVTTAPYAVAGRAHVEMIGAAGSPRAGRSLVADATFAVCGTTRLTACP